MKQSLAELDSPGGHILLSLVLIVISALLYKWKIPKAEDIIPFALGTLGRSMLGRNGKDAEPKP